MAFMREKKVKGHTYYQWVESYRENGKVKQRVLKHIGGFKQREKFERSLQLTGRYEQAIERFPHLPFLAGYNIKRVVELYDLVIRDGVTVELIVTHTNSKRWSAEEVIQALNNGEAEVVPREEYDTPHPGCYYHVAILKQSSADTQAQEAVAAEASK